MGGWSSIMSVQMSKARLCPIFNHNGTHLTFLQIETVCNNTQPGAYLLCSHFADTPSAGFNVSVVSNVRQLNMLMCTWASNLPGSLQSVIHNFSNYQHRCFCFCLVSTTWQSGCSTDWLTVVFIFTPIALNWHIFQMTVVEVSTFIWIHSLWSHKFSKL